MATQSIIQPATRTRHLVIVFSVALAIITYIDRVCISQAMIPISTELNFSKSQQGTILSAFALTYALFEIPAGWWGDRIGPRRVLMRIVIWWSFFTAATGWAWNFVSMVVIRALFGAGEAGCFPNVTKAFTMWLPPTEQVRAQGIMWMAARWGGAFTPLLVVQVLSWVSWRRAFEIFGALGIIWAVIFFKWFRDRPKDHPDVNAAELELITVAGAGETTHSVPWRKFLHSKQAWLLCGQYFCLSYGWYFYITWLPTYLKEGRGLTLERGALLATLPLFLGGCGAFLCGIIYPPLNRITGDVGKSRRIMAYLGFAGATGFLLFSTMLNDPLYAMLAMGMASFSNDLVMPGSWGACMDVGGKYAGTLSGTMNMAGNLGGAVSPALIGLMLDATGNNWSIAFYVSAAVYFAGLFFWLGLDPVTPLEKKAEA